MLHLRRFFFLLLAGLLTACSEQGKPGMPGGLAAIHLVEVATVRMEEVAASARRTGSLRAEREIRILPQEEGRIVALPRHAGDSVRQDDLLLQLDDALLLAELRKSEAQRRQMEIDVNRLAQLIHNHLVREEDLARARTALDIAVAEEQLLRTRLGYTRIHAPFAGVISERHAEPGDVVPRYSHILTLTDLSSLVTTTSVSELLLPHLAVGDAVTIQIDALGNTPYPGRILRMYPGINTTTRQGTVEVELTPVPAGARPGQLCRVQLTGHPQPRMLIPFAALRRDNLGEFVFVLDEEERARRHAVHSGLKIGEDIELLEGPAEGSKVIIKGFLGLLPGSKVQITGNKPADS